MEETDASVVQRAQAGDGDAFQALVMRHSRGVFRLAYRMTGNESDAEDIVQETFLKAYRQINRYESRSSFSTWLYSIAANCSLDLIRKRKRGQELMVEADDTPGFMQALPTEAPGPDRLAESNQVEERVSAAMADLSQQERTAFVLRHFEGLSIDEISSALGIGGNAAKHSIFRAVHKLRKALTPLVEAI